MKRYDKEFKERAIELSGEVGLKKASEQLGIPYATLAEWREKRVKNDKNKTVVSTNPDDEIARLKRENYELHKANSILKDALVFFVEDRKR